MKFSKNQTFLHPRLESMPLWHLSGYPSDSINIATEAVKQEQRHYCYIKHGTLMAFLLEPGPRMAEDKVVSQLGRGC